LETGFGVPPSGGSDARPPNSGTPNLTMAAQKQTEANMKFNREVPWSSIFGGLVAGLGLIAFPHEVGANVYATHIRLNGGTTNIAAAAGDIISISFLLNEPASLGTTVQIRSGANVVRSLSFLPQTQGTLRGFNEITWDGTDGSGQAVAGGTYSVAVLARSSGYTNWTQTTSDTEDLNTYVLDGRGIAVDHNPASPYYGRIFVANSFPGQGGVAGDTLGILKFNADTSDADEGVSSADTDGHAWTDAHTSPWKLMVSADDYVYVDDMGTRGEIFRWDPTFSSNSMVAVLQTNNQPPGAILSGPAITGAGTNTQIWMTDILTPTVYKWTVNGSMVCASNDTGSVIVTNTFTNFFDIALDPSANMYTCAYVRTDGDPSPRVFRYHAYDPSTNNGLPETNADWAVGAGDDTYAGASGIAVDPTGTYVAVAFEGPAGLFSTNGNTKILWATNGALVANLDLGLVVQGDANHDDTDCAWDAVGNVYYIDNYASRWRAISPPGTNQATTVGLATIQLSGAPPPPPPSGTLKIVNITVLGSNVNIDFTAGTNDSAASFSIRAASTVNGVYSKIAAVVTQVSPGRFHAVFPLGPATQYFRIVGQGTTPPPSQPAFTKITFNGANAVLTFSDNSGTAASAFTLLGASVVNGTYAPLSIAPITQTSPGVFQASVPLSGPAQFYRIRR
jgi:hypothetical protein